MPSLKPLLEELAMADAPTNPAADRIVTGRGPAYPAISLPKAMELVEKVRDSNLTRAAVSPEIYYKVWGYKGESGATRPLLAALNHYDLMEYVGRGDSKQVRLSALAHRIIFDKVPNSPDRVAALREAALTPTIFSRLRSDLGVPVPPEFVVETFLTRDCGYSESAAKVIYENYLETLELANLDKPDNMPPHDDAPEEGKPRNNRAPATAGDLVQVEINGAFALERPARVRAVQEHDGRSWVFIDGSEAGIPMDQIVVEEKGKAVAPTLPLGQHSEVEHKTPAPGTRREVFALDEGDLIISYPDDLSLASYEDLETYFQLFLRKAKRKAAAKRLGHELDGNPPEDRD
jgi:hypothetical protein